MCNLDLFPLSRIGQYCQLNVEITVISLLLGKGPMVGGYFKGGTKIFDRGDGVWWCLMAFGGV